MATTNTDYSAGAESLRTYLLNGSGSRTQWDAFIKAVWGDIKLNCSPATATPAPTSEAWTQTVTVTATTNDGELIPYSGAVTLAIGDTSTAGTASITPSAGAVAMTDGSLTVTIAGDAADWLNTETATLTVSPTANNAGIFHGSTIANATCVITFTA
jgi:hypothetical protein